MHSDPKFIAHSNRLPLVGILAALAFPSLPGCSMLGDKKLTPLSSESDSSQVQTDVSQYAYGLDRVERRVAKGRSIEGTVKETLALYSSDETQELKARLQLKCLMDEPRDFRELELHLRNIAVIKGILGRQDLGVLSRVADAHFASLAKKAVETNYAPHSTKVGKSRLKNIEDDLHAVARLLPYLSNEQKSVAYDIFRHIDDCVQKVPISEIVQMLEEDARYVRLGARDAQATARTRLELKCAGLALRPNMPGLPLPDEDDDDDDPVKLEQKHKQYLELQVLLKASPHWKINENGWEYAHTDATGSISAWHLELDFSGEYVTLRHAKNESRFAGELTEKFIARLKTKEIEKLIGEAIANDSCEVLSSRIDAWDLPQTGPIVDQRIIATQGDGVFRGSLLPSMLMARVLSERYGERVQVRPLAFCGNLSEYLTRFSEIPELTVDGATLFLDLYSHGYEGGLCFADRPNAKPIMKLFSQHPGLSGVVRSIACFGGGLPAQFMTEMNTNTTLRSRITVYTECKPRAVNILSGVGNGDQLRGTNYQRHLILNLSNPTIKTFGAAAHKADEDTKLDVQCDAEAVIDGELIGCNSSPADILDAAS